MNEFSFIKDLAPVVAITAILCYMFIKVIGSYNATIQDISIKFTETIKEITNNFSKTILDFENSQLEAHKGKWISALTELSKKDDHVNKITEHFSNTVRSFSKHEKEKENH